MAYQIRSDEEAYQVLYPALKAAVEYAMEQIWKLNKKEIQEWVYNKYQPTVYKRSKPTKNGFSGAWNVSIKNNILTKVTHTVTGVFDYAPEKMKLVAYRDAHHRKHIRHASDVTYEDVREELADIIYQGLAGHIYGEGEWTKPRNAFKELDEALGEGKLAQFIEKGMRSAGIKFKVVNRNFTKTTMKSVN